MILDIPPRIEQIIISQAQMQGVSVSEIVAQKFETAQYQKGDIRRLKGIANTNIKASLDDINNAIVQGAVYGE